MIENGTDIDGNALNVFMNNSFEPELLNHAGI